MGNIFIWITGQSGLLFCLLNMASIRHSEGQHRKNRRIPGVTHLKKLRIGGVFKENSCRINIVA